MQSDQARGASLAALAAEVGSRPPARDVAVTGIAHDSRRVHAGDLFVALPGRRQDGARFVADALDRGAVAVCVAAGARAALAAAADAGVPALAVDEPRLALARLAAAFHGHPARELRLVGITGTLGKTSTALLVQAALARLASDDPAHAGAAEPGIGVIGSLGARVRGPAAARVPPGALPDFDGMTTPDAPALHQALRAMADAGVRTVVMEVTSHALAHHRVAGIVLALGVLTNLVPDEHLEFHPTPEDYLRTKARFFEHLAPGAPVVVNADDPLVRGMVAAAVARVPRPVVAVSMCAPHDASAHDGDPAVCVEALRWDAGGSSFALHVRRALPRLDGPGARAGVPPLTLPVAIPVLGVQQAANAALAAAAALVAGATPTGVTEGLAGLEQMRRRMEIVRRAAPLVVDDTAGNPETLRAVFASVASVPRATLRVAFGVRGLRGPEINRGLAEALAELAAAAAASAAVRLVVTASEDVADARNRVQPEERDAVLHTLDEAGVAYEFVATLRDAIATLLDGVGDDDLVLLLGAQGMDRAAGLARAALDARARD